MSTCPRCGHLIPNDREPGAYPGALSRTDNQTEVCSPCGVEEAMMQMVGQLQSQDDWPVTAHRS